MPVPSAACSPQAVVQRKALKDALLAQQQLVGVWTGVLEAQV